MELRAPDNRVLDAVLAQPERVALLVYLAVARPVGFHRRDRLLALFWPELDDATARDALSEALHFLRQSLGSEVILTRSADEIGVDAARLWCDATAFRAALDRGQPDDALRLYEGDFLHRFLAEESGGFTAWVESERASLREVAARGARKLAEMHGDRGDHTSAVAWGRRSAELTPDDERAFRRLLGFLDGAGDHAGALQAYEAFAGRLRAEHGAEPAAETRAIIDAIRREAASTVLAPTAGTPPGRVLLSPNVQWPAAQHGAPGSEAFGAGVSLADGRYIIERVLGVGGMATVYLARDVRHQRQVAVKVLKPSVAPAVDAEGLLREIRIAANLQHPHIVPLFDSGESGGRVFYVMPYVVGESLGARLRRDPSMPIDLALRIGRHIARALAYAHAQGIVHRDIKPDNVLLSGDATGELHAMVSDFGLAKAIDASRSRASLSGEGTLTPFGGMAGTPRYMSPEQAVGDRVDCRADLYAWGVLTYEMLTGAHPFDAQFTPRQVIAAHISTDPEPLSSRREDVPASMATLVMQCLEKEPERRPADGAALVAALDGNLTPPLLAIGRRPQRRLQWLAGLAAVVVLGGSIWVTGPWRASAPKGAVRAEAATETTTLDTTRYVILPFEHDSAVTASLHEVDRLRDAFSRWRGVSLVDEFQMREALARRSPPRLTSVEAQQLAARLGAGRYVRGEIRLLGGAMRVYAAAYDTRSNERLRDTTLRVANESAVADTAFWRLADHLLFGSADRSAEAGQSGTSSLPARQAFGAGQAALQRWDLPAADSQFFTATRFDDAYAEAWLWAAQVRSWRRSPVTQWSFAAQQALLARDRLSSRDRILAEALADIAHDDLPKACAELMNLTRRDPVDFVGWYAASDCLARDNAVVRDAASPSGWRFRTSYHQRIQTYRRALELLPSIHRALAGRAFELARVRLKTRGNALEVGRALAPDTGTFLAYPGWASDTLVFVPYPAAQFARADANVVPRTLGEAVRRQRRVFHEVASVWASAFPTSSDALEALAISLQLIGDPASIDTLRRSRLLALGRDDRVRIAALEVWTRIRFALPGNVAELRTACAIADSLLRSTPVDSLSDVGPLLSLAALTGRATLAATLGRHPSMRGEMSVRPALGDIALPLVLFGAFGGPPDTLAALE